MKKQVYVSNESWQLLKKTRECQGAVLRFPNEPLTPIEIIAGCKKAWEDEQPIITTSEIVILWISRQIRCTYDKEQGTPEVEIRLDDFSMYLVRSSGITKLEIGEYGDFLTEWEGGCFEERFELIF